MCAGSAQVTLIELRGSCYTGYNPTEEQDPKKPHTPHTKKTPKQGNNLLRNSCGLAGTVKKDETGAMNSAVLSVHLVPEKPRKCLRHSWQRREVKPSDRGRYERVRKSPQQTGGVDKLCPLMLSQCT